MTELLDELPRVGALHRFEQVLLGVLVRLHAVRNVLLDVVPEELGVLRYQPGQVMQRAQVEVGQSVAVQEDRSFYGVVEAH